MKKKKRPSKKKTLKHGISLVDAWSMPHFLFGAVFALGALAFGTPLFETFIVLLAIAVLWEFWERGVRIKESKWNIASDIIMPVCAYGLIVNIVPRELENEAHVLALFMISLLLYIYFNYVAWQARAYKARDFLN